MVVQHGLRRDHCGSFRKGFVNISTVATNSVTSVWVVPLGQTPGYLDPQSHEALHEVDVSGMALRFSFGQRLEREAIGNLG